MTNGRQGTAVLASRPSPPRRTPWRVAEPVALDVQYAVFVPHHAVDPILANRLDIEADRDRHGAEVPAVPVEELPQRVAIGRTSRTLGPEPAGVIEAEVQVRRPRARIAIVVVQRVPDRASVAPCTGIQRRCPLQGRLP